MKLPLPDFANADQALLHRFAADDAYPQPFDVNPMARTLGTVLHAVDRQAGRVELAFLPDPLFIQGNGVIQGGALTSMLDFAMAFATLAHMPRGDSCTTVNLSVAFLRPAAVGHYRAIGEVERCGRQLAFTRAQLLRQEDGQVIATATSTLALMRAADRS